VEARGVLPGAAGIAFGFDPLGDLAAGSPEAPPWQASVFAAVIRDLAATGYRGPFAVADGRVIHNAGGSEAQELAFVLAVAVAYLRALEAGGIALADARRMLTFRLAADADQFLTMAKFRALRTLWARVEEACGLAPAPAFVAAETAWRMMTRRDPFVNVLRATVAVVAAGLGGADSIAVVPHTAAIGLPDSFARRLARNTQLILLEESNLARVADPAAGAGGLGSLTHDLCVTAWQRFQEIERAGGAAAALAQGLIQYNVAAVRAERERAVARRKEALTGTSEFPDIAEVKAEVLAPSPLVPGLPGAARGTPAVAGGTPPLPCRRLAEPFEALRDVSDRILAETGARPKIFLANLGRLADFTARATWTKNFFEAGGIEAATNDGFTTNTDMIAAFKASGARLACLCGSDETYEAVAIAAAETLRAAGVAHVYLAGRPEGSEAVLWAAGVGTFIYVGCDAVATLAAAYDKLI
jgi:methylmalonyl-CoA mutase